MNIWHYSSELEFPIEIVIAIVLSIGSYILEMQFLGNLIMDLLC